LLTRLRRKVSLEKRKKLSFTILKVVIKGRERTTKKRHLEINHLEDDATVSFGQDWSIRDLN